MKGAARSEPDARGHLVDQGSALWCAQLTRDLRCLFCRPRRRFPVRPRLRLDNQRVLPRGLIPVGGARTEQSMPTGMRSAVAGVLITCHDAGSSQASSALGGSRAGARVAGPAGRPSVMSRLLARVASATTAMTLRRSPHGQRRTFSANTRRNRSAHGSRRARHDGLRGTGGAVSLWSEAGTSGRSFARALLGRTQNPSSAPGGD